VTDSVSPYAISWQDFANQEPELARFGAEKLSERPAYLATIHPSGAPRVHPVTPIISTLGLFLFMEPTSPKAGDLEERGRYSMHNGVADNTGAGGEFNLSGAGFTVEDVDIWSTVAEVASYVPAQRYILFELRLSEARCRGYGDVTLPSTRRWSL
jgi:hypothetical protein